MKNTFLTVIGVYFAVAAGEYATGGAAYIYAQISMNFNVAEMRRCKQPLRLHIHQPPLVFCTNSVKIYGPVKFLDQ